MRRYEHVMEIPTDILARCDKAIAEICGDAALEIVRVVMGTKPAGWTKENIK